jgi:hypothetical protein
MKNWDYVYKLDKPVFDSVHNGTYYMYVCSV